MKDSVVKTTILVVLFQVCCTGAFTRWEKENAVMTSILKNGRYNSEIRPVFNNSGPVIVTTNMYIRSLSDPDEMNMEYSVQITFRQQWKDERLAYNQSEVAYLTLTDTYRIWTPDPFFSNEISGNFHNIVTPNVLLRIYPNGDVLYSIRLSVKLSCPMDLKYYPLDTQICSIILASYGYTTEDVAYLWKKLSPVQVTKNTHNSRFTLDRYTTDYCTSRTNTGEYSCLKVDFQFRREFNRYFLDIYLPTIGLVIISWLCFALDHKDTTARIVLFATVFLAFSMKAICLNNKVPVTTYQTSYSVWMTTCYVFLAVVIAKIAYDSFMLRRQKKMDAFALSSDENDAEKNKLSSEEEPRTKVSAILRFYYRLMRRYPSAQQKTDVICLILFPVAFALFNIFYWIYNVPHYD